MDSVDIIKIIIIHFNLKLASFAGSACPWMGLGPIGGVSVLFKMDTGYKPNHTPFYRFGSAVHVVFMRDRDSIFWHLMECKSAPIYRLSLQYVIKK